MERDISENLMNENLHYLMNPKTVAIIGASRNPASFSYPIPEIVLRYGYTGKLYLINPRADYIFGLKCYPSILDVPEDVDVALIAIPKEVIEPAIEECIEKGVKGIVIVTAGYAEQGNAEGRKRQEELVGKAVKKGIRIIGPNTLGYYTAPVSLDLLMSGFIKKGQTALLTQSGNLTTSLTFPGAERGLGFNSVIDLGNQADLQAHDFIKYFSNDEDVKTIAVHIEGLRDGRKFMQEVKEAVKVKPVLVIKSGRTETGARIVSSHTASIAGNDEIYKAAFKQCGAIQIESFTEFTSALLALNQGKIPKGNRMCIISEGGGDCALTSDACTYRGLAIPELGEDSKERLRQIIPKNGSVVNPIDLAGWENVLQATEIVLEDESVDGVIVVGGFAGFFNISPGDYEKEEEYVLKMCELVAKTQKPVLIYSYFASYKTSKLVDILREHNVPLFMDHHDAVNTMAILVKYNELKTKMVGRSFVSELKNDENNGRTKFISDEVNTKGSILEPQAKQILKMYNLPYPEERMANDQNEAVKYADEIGYPVVLKIVSKDILHKSDAGCVKLGLNNCDEVKEAYNNILNNAKKFNKDAEISGVLVSKMDIEDGVEIIIGGVNDPIFGPVIMFGIGGIFVEVLKDVSFRVCPIDEIDADEMIREIRGYSMLTGIRGKAAVDIESIKDALMNVSKLLMENPQISEIDLNPIKVHTKGLLALDARIITG